MPFLLFLKKRQNCLMLQIIDGPLRVNIFKTFFQKTNIIVSNSLDPNRGGQRLVGPILGPKCLKTSGYQQTTQAVNPLYHRSPKRVLWKKMPQNTSFHQSEIPTDVPLKI